MYLLKYFVTLLYFNAWAIGRYNCLITARFAFSLLICGQEQKVQMLSSGFRELGDESDKILNILKDLNYQISTLEKIKLKPIMNLTFPGKSCKKICTTFLKNILLTPTSV